MNALLVVAHPSGESFSHAILSAASKELEQAGYALVIHDLYAEGFDPVQRAIESANNASSDALVETHCAELRRADLIILIHPNWWSQPPAILKGWVDRVFRLDTAYGYPEGVGYEGEPVGLLKARHALVFNTSNTPSQREREVFGDPLDTLWRNSVFALCGVSSVYRRMFGPMASSSVLERSAWLEEVREMVRRVV
jgi:NAD(P)H dehydrogenase (quinone)